MGQSLPRAVAVLGAIGLLCSVALAHPLPVICVHLDGTTELESGADRCCQERRTAEGGGETLSSPSGGDCPGCRDLLVTWSGDRRERTAPAVIGLATQAAIPAATRQRGSATRIEPTPASAAARSPGACLPLRV